MIVWFEGQDAGTNRGELWALLRRHGFVNGDHRTVDAATLQRLEAMGEDLLRDVNETLAECMTADPQC